MKDVKHEQYVSLMQQIEELEDELESATKKKRKKGNPADTAEKQQRLADLRRELQRISDGCGRPFHGI
jgi:Mg2+ and Co2+ transporter CorA